MNRRDHGQVGRITTEILLLLGAVALVLVLLVLDHKPARGQAAQAPAAAKQEEETKVGVIAPVDLSGPQAEVKAKLTELVEKGRAKGLEGVRLIGQARSTGQSPAIGQVVWVGVAADVNGAERQAALSSPLKSSFVAKQKALPAGTTVSATGDVEAMLSAARKLFDVRDEKKEADKAEKKDQPKAPAQAAGGGKQNEVAAQGYQPLPLQPKEAEAAALPVAFGITTDGCTPRVDEAQGVVIVQSRQTKSEGGAVTPTGACSDSETRYPIQKSYSVCQDQVELAELKAYPQFRKYFVGESGETSYLGECEKDTAGFYAITEDAKACTYQVNLEQMQARERAELVYTNKNNTRVVVRGCEATAKAALPIIESEGGCSLRHDFQAKVSYQQKKKTFTDHEGVLRVVSDCADVGQAMAHEDVRGVCADLVDNQAGKAYPQRRWRITPPSGPLFITECTPVAGEATGLAATVEGCESVFFHNMAAGQSFGANRWFYQFTNGVKTFVTGCQQSEQTFVHQTEVQGYENHDEGKFAYPKTAIFINAPVGRVDVSPAQVRSAAPQLAYSFKEQKTVPQPDQASYDGCNKYVPSLLSDVYKRPDGSEAIYPVGSGPSAGPTDVCISTVIDSRTLTTGSYAYNGGPGANCDADGGATFHYPRYSGIFQATINKVQKKNPETGLVVSSSCGFASTWKQQSIQTYSSNRCGGEPGAVGEWQSLFVPPCPF